MLKFNRYIFSAASFFLIILVSLSSNALAQNTKIFKTAYTDIYYNDEADLKTFLWRISGKRFIFPSDLDAAESSVDRIIERAESILDMQPDHFRIKLELYPKYEDGMIAFYSYKKNSITIYTDRVTDGVFAHEVSHSVICNYFDEPPPAKVQEILCQYVDRHLWSDY